MALCLGGEQGPPVLKRVGGWGRGSTRARGLDALLDLVHVDRLEHLL